MLPFNSNTLSFPARPPLPRAAAGTLGVYMAPASLCFVGWVTLCGGTEGQACASSVGGEGFAYFLLALSVATWLRFLAMAPGLAVTWLRSPSPSYASVTFPSDIVTIACTTAYSRYGGGSPALAALCWLLLVVTTVIVLCVLAWFVRGLASGALLSPPQPPAAAPPADGRCDQASKDDAAVSSASAQNTSAAGVDCENQEGGKDVDANEMVQVGEVQVEI